MGTLLSILIRNPIGPTFPSIEKVMFLPRSLRRPLNVRRAKPFSPPKLLPEEIALESAILAAAARDVAELHR